MNEKEQLARDLQEFRELWPKLSPEGQRKSNNELFNLALNRCKHPRQVYNALAMFPKEGKV